jgi:hypothetical protein
MGLLKKKPDPISDRSRQLNAKIAELEAKIKRLNQDLEPGPAATARSSPFHQEDASQPPPTATAPAPAPANPDPIFEKVDQNRLKTPTERPTTADHFNELGVRKYDLLSLIDRLRKQFQPPPAANPRLVNYLAAGSIQGLRPLRYEKRVARNRFVALLVVLGLVCMAIICYALERRR